ncbi:hypothetical protein L3X38_025715 [Prunus dulcis]|uniref:Uncharacterized protein n=1 Tax=Prunus dulcis TaxID=3755 RepID=A0AAD4W4Y3_PRUDU|nr:hypothetical protein L3X38_025715 [Prunus dulcis]
MWDFVQVVVVVTRVLEIRFGNWELWQNTLWRKKNNMFLVVEEIVEEEKHHVMVVQEIVEKGVQNELAIEQQLANVVLNSDEGEAI